MTYVLTNLAIAMMTASSAPYQDLDALDARVASLLGGSGTAFPIDRRIKLATCPEEPELSAPSVGAVSIRCISLGWKLRVPATGPSGKAGSSGPMLVHRGDTIELVSRGPGYFVSSMGTAVEDGSAGAPIRVKIPTSPSPVSAVIARAGVASIPN